MQRAQLQEQRWCLEGTAHPGFRELQPRSLDSALLVDQRNQRQHAHGKGCYLLTCAKGHCATRHGMTERGDPTLGESSRPQMH